MISKNLNTKHTENQDLPQVVEVHPEVKGLKGGKKQFWLNNHRPEVESYYFTNGADATLIRFNLLPETLKRFLVRKNPIDLYSKMSQSDRAILQIVQSGDADLRRRIDNIENILSELVPVMDFLKQFGEFLSSKIQLNTKLEPVDDPLSLKDFMPKKENKVKSRDRRHNIYP